MLARLEQLAGLVLVAVTLADVFLNVLYARAGIAILSRPLAHAVRNLFVALARLPAATTPGCCPSAARPSWWPCC